MEQLQTGHGAMTVPVELTGFIGRTAELAALRQLIAASRLLTLTGAGGSGKSRLALELARELATREPDGVVWVELAPLEDGSLIPHEIMRALGTPAEPRLASVETVTSSLRDRGLVLVLDNCEHLVDACATLVAALLRNCASLRVLATSREALGVAGERAWLTPPLALPEPAADAAAVAAADAVQLFVDRARDVQPEFAVTPQNAAAVAAICTQLDGIPLALELAAARVRHMSPEQIRDRLSDAFALLTTGARTALPRHRTLRATLDWSHDLLPEPARVVLRRLGVFRGGFTLDAAEQVASGDGIATAAVLDLVAVLVDRSLVVVREHHGNARYQLLETVRQYATQRLAQAGEEMGVRGALADFITRLVTAVEPAFITSERRAAFDTLEPELDNIRDVLHWTHAHAPAQHVRLVGLLWWFWFSTRHWVEAHRWIAGALALPAAAEPTRERAALLFAAGALGSLRAQVDEPVTLLTEAIALAAQHGDERLEAYAQNYLGMVYAGQGRVEARDYSGRAERWFRSHDDLYGLRLALLLVGMAERSAGNDAEAIRLTREAVDVARRFGQDRELGVALQNLAMLYLELKDHATAHPLVVECLAALRRDPAYLFIYRGLDYLAITTMDSDPHAAARRLGAAEAVRQHIGAARFRFDQMRVDALVPVLRARLGDAEFERLHAEGFALGPTRALDGVFDAAAELARFRTAAERPLGAAPERSAQPEGPTAGAAAAAPATPPRAAAAADLSVRALGPFEVSVRGTRVETWPYAKPKELLAYLLCHPQGRTRVDIGSAMWPDATPAQVRNSFHVTLHHLRKTLGHADWIVQENERYRLAASVSVDFDVVRFDAEVRAGLTAATRDAAAAIATLRDALAHYRDHFLVAEAAGAWRDDEQDRLRRLFCDGGVRLGTLLVESGELSGAAAAYEAVVAREPLHEEAHRGLLLCWTRAGNRAHALRHYERFAARLRHELDLEPDPETEALYEQIRSAAGTAPLAG